jgi:Txe/YoeB family toxin of Txe-Axe toxin-antitoxin module
VPELIRWANNVSGTCRLTEVDTLRSSTSGLGEMEFLLTTLPTVGKFSRQVDGEDRSVYNISPPLPEMKNITVVGLKNGVSATSLTDPEVRRE